MAGIRDNAVLSKLNDMGRRAKQVAEAMGAAVLAESLRQMTEVKIASVSGSLAGSLRKKGAPLQIHRRSRWKKIKGWQFGTKHRAAEDKRKPTDGVKHRIPKMEKDPFVAVVAKVFLDGA